MTDAWNDRTGLIGRLRAGMAAVAVALPLLSCSDALTGPSDLAGGAWRLQSMEPAGESPFVPEEANRFTVEFHADGRIGVVADCNQCGGTYTLRDETLTVPGMTCTLVLCATPRGGQFTSLIEGASSLDKSGDDRLEVESSRGKLVLRR